MRQPRKRRVIKRIMDLLIVVPTIILLIPVLLALGTAIAIALGRPVLFRQQRPGLAGHPFTLVKFRTMIDRRAADGTLLADSERLTPFGRWLRSTSLDELPELWNVLLGQMSLVGPRPLLMQYIPRYSQRQARRHEVPPGITGWAQINGRNAISWEDKLEMDVWYVESWSLGLDLKILAATLRSVIRRTGITAADSATMPEFTGSAQTADRDDSAPSA